MAVHTSLANVFKAPLPIVLQVAGKAGRGQVCPRKRKARVEVLLQRIGAGQEALYGMAAGTIGGHVPHHKIAFVVIFVAGSTSVVGQGLRKTFRYMAFPAIDGLVFAQQCKIGEAVIKSLGINLGKRLFIVAVGTLQTKLALMLVFMASITGVGSHAQPILKERSIGGIEVVAGGTVERLVSTPEREVGAVVVKFVECRSGGKRLLIVALFAIVAQVVLVRILVAIVAAIEGYPGKHLKGLAIAGFVFVAGLTAYGLVFARQRKLGAAVIKLGGRRKGFGGMAFGTLVGQGALVVVFVAGGASPVEAQVSFG